MTRPRRITPQEQARAARLLVASARARMIGAALRRLSALKQVLRRPRADDS